MEKIVEPIVYRGMNANQISEAYDDHKTIPNLDLLLQENRERAKVIKDKLNPICDLSYGNEPIQKLDIYAPKNAKELPVLIDVHGGGWVAGSKNPRSIPAESIISKNIIWVTIDYGLAPEYRMCDMVSHIRKAVVWIYNNIAQYGGDPSRLYISGQSSGAHLAATTIMPGWHKNFDVPEKVIKGLIALSGIYDLDGLFYSCETSISDALKLSLEESRQYSPMYHLPQHSIPTLIAYGSKEPLAYAIESKDYIKSLENAGCSVSLQVVPDANHFDMINALSNKEGSLFKSAIKMILKE